MKYWNYSALLVAGFLTIVAGCQTQDRHNGHSPEHGHEEETTNAITYTLWSGNTELFIEIDPLVKGNEIEYAAHFTDLETYKPVESGTFIIRLVKDGQVTNEHVDSLLSIPGIFRSHFIPKEFGKHRLSFMLKRQRQTDTFSVDSILVYSSTKQVPINGDDGSDAGDITFLKDQAWKTDFSVTPVHRKNIHKTIRTSGKITAPPGNETVVSATSSGLVSFVTTDLQIGSRISKGQDLFIIKSQELLSDNIQEKYRKKEAQLEMAKANFERAESLIQDNIIGQKEYEKRKLEYEIALAEWNNISDNHGKQGSRIKSPLTGVITKIYVKPNEFAREGARLVEITDQNKIQLHAEVSQKYIDIIPTLTSAHFKTIYRDELFRTVDHNGRLISYGNALDKDHRFIPVWFEMDRPEGVIIGSYVEVYLLTKEKEDRVVIPRSALMQDYNTTYVFVQKSGETFEKREIKTGISDGLNVEVTSGIKEGEYIVTKGAYQVKMASMSSEIPGHGHAH